MTEEIKEVLKQGEATLGTEIAKPAGTEPPAKDISETPAGAQPPKTDAGNVLEEVKTRLAKLEEDKKKIEEERDNYRAGMIAAKAKKTTLTPEFATETYTTPPPPVYAPPTPPPVDDNFDYTSRRGVEQIVEQKARQIVDARDRTSILQNEQIALKKWMQKHPELVDDTLREIVTQEYAPKHGRSVDGILYDLDRAYTYFKIDRGYETKQEMPSVEQRKSEAILASVPSGGGKSESNLPTFNDFESQVIQQYEISPEQFKTWKQKVKNGEMEVPQSVYDKLFNSQ